MVIKGDYRDIIEVFNYGFGERIGIRGYVKVVFVK